MTKIGSKIRSKSSGITGKVTERIVIERGHQLVAPLPGDLPALDTGEYAERVDLRVEYVDAAGNAAEALIHESDAESA